MITYIYILIFLLIITIIVNIIQYKRQIQLENNIDSIHFNELEYVKFFDKLYDGIESTYATMKQIDHSGAFKHDDEVGYVFNSLHNIVKDLKHFLDDAKKSLGRAEEKEEK